MYSVRKNNLLLSSFIVYIVHCYLARIRKYSFNLSAIFHSLVITHPSNFYYFVNFPNILYFFSRQFSCIFMIIFLCFCLHFVIVFLAIDRYFVITGRCRDFWNIFMITDSAVISVFRDHTR
jgi:hypothetical protein